MQENSSRSSRFLTPKAAKILLLLRQYADNEQDENDLVFDLSEGRWYCGCEPCTKQGNELQQLMLITVEMDGKDLVYYRINESGRRALTDPDFEPPGIAVLGGRQTCDCADARRAPTRYGTCGTCGRALAGGGQAEGDC